MITQSVQFTISCDNGCPIDWTISSNNDCVTFSLSEGTVTAASETINLVAYYSDESCFGAILTITATDTCNGVVTTQTITPQNPCSTLSGYILKVPTLIFPFRYQATVTGGTPGYTYQWIFDDSIFSGQQTGPGNNLYLALRNGVTLPASTEIQVIVKDARGCEETLLITESFNAPVAKNSSARVGCLNESLVTDMCGTVNQVATYIKLEAVPYGNRTIDWSTVEFDIPSGLCVRNDTIPPPGSNVHYITIYGFEAPTNDYQIGWTVKDSIGVISNTAYIYASVPECVEATKAYIEPVFYAMNAAEIAGADVEIDLKTIVHPQDCCEEVANDDDRVDWKTFTFVPTSKQVLVTPTELTTTNGTAVLQLDRTLLYTPGVLSCDTDLVQFTVETKGGLKSNTGKVAFDWIRVAAPVAVADAECVVCDETVEIDVLANDTGEINPASIRVTTNPYKGTYTVGTDGKIRFTAFPAVSGADSIGYKVANPDGELSNEGTVTLDIICGGPNIYPGDQCKVTIDLEAMLPSYATAGGVWSASLSNPSVVVLAVPTAVDFSGATAGTYQFSYSITSGGGCSTRVDIIFELLDDLANDECAGAITLSYPTVAGRTQLLVNQEITVCGTVSADPTPTGWYGAYPADAWFEFVAGAVTDVKVFLDATKYDAGLVNPQIVVYSGACGALVEEASNSIYDGSRYIDVDLTGLTPGNTYFVRVSGSNTGMFTMGLTT